MVQKFGKTINLLNKQENILTDDSRVRENYRLAYERLSEMSINELLEVASYGKAKELRCLAVHLLGRKRSNTQQIQNKLKELVKYEHRLVSQEAIWSLARLGDCSVQPLLTKLLARELTELDRTITCHLLGEIGDRTSIEPLLQVCSQRSELASISAGTAIQKITSREGIDTLLRILHSAEPPLKIMVVWLIAARIQFDLTPKDHPKILDVLKEQLESESNLAVRVAIAYNLCVLNQFIGAKALAGFCISGRLPKDRQGFFMSEVVRFFVYQQKIKSLEISGNLKTAIDSLYSLDSSCKKDLYHESKKLLRQLDDAVEALDSIFELLL